MIIGTVDNSSKAHINFQFFTGQAGIRELNDGRLEVTCFAQRAAAAKGEGQIGDLRYVVDGPASSSLIKGMVIMQVRLSQ